MMDSETPILKSDPLLVMAANFNPFTELEPDHPHFRKSFASATETTFQEAQAYLWQRGYRIDVPFAECAFIMTCLLQSAYRAQQALAMYNSGMGEGLWAELMKTRDQSPPAVAVPTSPTKSKKPDTAGNGAPAS